MIFLDYPINGTLGMIIHIRGWPSVWKKMLEKFYKLTQHCLKFLSHHALSHSKQTLFKKVTFNYVLLNRNSCLLLAVEKVAHVAHWYQNHHYKWFQWCGQRLGDFNQYLPFRNYLCSFTSSNEQSSLEILWNHTTQQLL